VFSVDSCGDFFNMAVMRGGAGQLENEEIPGGSRFAAYLGAESAAASLLG
jgi:hypothetical protein